MIYAPVVLFVYNRLWHAEQTINALLLNKEANQTDLIIYSDAPKNQKSLDIVCEVRKYLKKIEGFKSIKIIERSHNFGLSRSIIDGVTSACKKHGRVIVLEDDLVVSQHFLSFMNMALEKYANTPNVISIHGYIYPIKTALPETFFLRGADCWGWATWDRAWSLFNPEGEYLLSELKRRRLLNLFDYEGAYNFSGMLEGQILGMNDSWAIRWHASAFLQNKLTLYPGRSLVKNIGNDGTGVHCRINEFLDVVLSSEPIRLDDFPVKESILARKVVKNFFLSHQPPLRFILSFIIPIEMKRRLFYYGKKFLPANVVKLLRGALNWGNRDSF